MDVLDEWKALGQALASVAVAGLLLLLAPPDASAFWLPTDFGVNNPLLAIAVGDSITLGVLGVMPRRTADRPYPTVVQNLIAPSVPGFVVLNTGVGGEPTDLGARRMPTQLTTDHPGFALIMEGTNDANAGESPSVIAGNLRAMVRAAKANDTIPILGTIPPNFADPHANAIVAATNGLLASIAAEERIHLVDVYGALNNSGYFGPDDDHPIQSGYDALGAAVASVLAQAIAESGALLGGAYVAGGSAGGVAGEVVTGRGRGHDPVVGRFLGGALPGSPELLDAYGSFKGGVRVATCDVKGHGDGTLDIVTGAGPGGGPHVLVFDGSDPAHVLMSFFAFDPAFAGGVFVACGVLEAGKGPDIVVGAGRLGGPHVRVFRYNPANAGGVQDLGVSFFAYDGGFRGGVSVAVGRLSPLDTRDAIVTGAGPGGGPHVRAFRYFPGSPGNVIDTGLSFFAYDPAFTGGVNVAAGDLDGDGAAEIITGAGRGGGPHVRAWRFAPSQPGNVASTSVSFFAYDPAFTGGVNVAAGDLDGDGAAEIITGAGPGGGPHVRTLTPSGTDFGPEFFAYQPPYP